MITLSAQLAMAANASTSMSRWKCAHYEKDAFDVDHGTPTGNAAGNARTLFCF
jgi:hypothetical protein